MTEQDQQSTRRDDGQPGQRSWAKPTLRRLDADQSAGAPCAPGCDGFAGATSSCGP